MKRTVPFGEQVDISSDEDDVKPDNDLNKLLTKTFIDDQHLEELFEDDLVRSCRMYQEYMQKLPIPSHHGSVIPFTSWMGLAASLKRVYGQPLHYLTNIQVRQWDQLRIGAAKEGVPLDTIIHPSKAEASVWAIEEIHRRTSSHLHLSKLWQADPRHYAYIDPIVPKLPTPPK
nr:protein RDM1 [Ipomoea batatas]